MINIFILIFLIVIVLIIMFYYQYKYKQRVTQLNQELKIKIEQEVEKNKQQQLLLLQQNRLAQMGEMIAMIAHQWRQPLNSLSLINQMITVKYKNGNLDDKIMDTFTDKSKDLIQHMSKTIDDFRNFYKITNKEQKCFNANESIQEVLNIIEPMIKASNISITKHQDKEPFFIYGHSNEFTQAILNILQNAKDALIENKINKKHINIFIDGDEKSIFIRIEDNAGGIPKDIIDKIFDPYFSTKTEKNGTGLGLYMVKTIILDHMQGDISVTNTNDGASFKITLKRCC